MTLRLKNGQFASVAKARKERNPWFHRALISAAASLRAAGFEGETGDPTINERTIMLDEPLFADDILDIADRVESTKIFPDVLYNISFLDSTGRWFATSKAWESVELCMIDVKRNIAKQMEKYQRADKMDDEDYTIEAIMVSVYPWRK